MFRMALPVFTFACLLTFIVSAAVAQDKSPGRAAPGVASVAKSPININSATAAEFETLPGIGAKTAARIVEYRQKNGPFKKIEDLMNVRGVGEKSFLKLRPQLTVTPAKADHER